MLVYAMKILPGHQLTIARMSSSNTLRYDTPPLRRRVVDHNKNGLLEPHELAPVIVDMMAGIDHSGPPMTLKACLDFVGLVFDQNGDGTIDRNEFFYLIEFVVVSYIPYATQTHRRRTRHNKRRTLPLEPAQLTTQPGLAYHGPTQLLPTLPHLPTSRHRHCFRHATTSSPSRRRPPAAVAPSRHQRCRATSRTS